MLALVAASSISMAILSVVGVCSKTWRSVGSLLGYGCLHVYPCGFVPSSGWFGRQFLCPHGGNRPLLATEEYGLQGVLLSAVVGISYRRRHFAEKLTTKDLSEFPKQLVIVGEEPAQAACEAHHPLPHFARLGGSVQVPL